MNAIIVGSGWARMAAGALAGRSDVRVRGLVARGSARSVELARSLDVPLFRTVEDAVAAATPSLAVVAVGDEDNARLSAELLRAGAHVLCAHPVGRMPEDVARLARVAAENGRIVSTDYSMRMTEAFRAGLRAIEEAGELLRAEVTFPGRFLPIVLDLALGLCGAVAALTAFESYPETLRARRAAVPAAFPPTVVLEHRSGAVTALTPSPHAPPHAAIRVTTSSGGGRIDIALPAGGARNVRVVLSRRGFAETILAAPAPASDARSPYREAMAALANAFVDAVVSGGEPPSPLAGEVEVRRLWNAIPRSVALRGRVELAEETT